MVNYNYTLSIIWENEIIRLYYTNKEEAEQNYNELYELNEPSIKGTQLWQHRQDKTIDTDPLARIIKQYYK